MVWVKKALLRLLNKFVTNWFQKLTDFGGKLCRLPWVNREQRIWTLHRRLFFVSSSSQLLSMHRSHTASLVLQQPQQHQQLFATPFLWQWLFLPPIVRLNPSLSLSVYLSPSLHTASIFLFWHRAALSSPAPPSRILPTSNNSLSSVSPPFSLHLYLPGYIRSSLRCLGLWQPVSYSKWFWHCAVCAVR